MAENLDLPAWQKFSSFDEFDSRVRIEWAHKVRVSASVAYLECAKGGKSPNGVQGQSPGRGLGDEVPQKLTLFCY